MHAIRFVGFSFGARDKRSSCETRRSFGLCGDGDRERTALAAAAASAEWDGGGGGDRDDDEKQAARARRCTNLNVTRARSRRDNFRVGGGHTIGKRASRLHNRLASITRNAPIIVCLSAAMRAEADGHDAANIFGRPPI